MKNAFLLQTTCCLLLLASCRKGLDLLHEFPNPLTSDNQVVEYHKTMYDEAYPPRFPFLFKKTYDPSGKIVKEIACSFWDDQIPSQSFLDRFYHIFKVEQKARMIYLINNKQADKTGTPDTVARITLNSKGRAITCKANSELNPDGYVPAITEYYIYQDDRLIAVRSDYEGRQVPTYIDSVYYDQFGNLLSFGGNTYQYDYSRKARLQYYCDDYQGSDEPFYVLQYLGFFPEFNCPVNVRTYAFTVVGPTPETNHQFDSQGRLTSYDFEYSPVSIVWK